jgi:hypothetical protein
MRKCITQQGAAPPGALMGFLSLHAPTSPPGASPGE